MMANNEHRYSPQEVADVLKISKSTLLRHEKEGRIPPLKRYNKGPKKGWRYATEDDLVKLKVIFKKYNRS